ncbi:hypothetical protein Tco_0605506 [Tanacetum coccineum]
MDSNFNNENEPWEFSLDIDDSDLQLTPVVHSYSSTHVQPSPLTPNPVTIISGPSSTVVEPSSSTSNPVRIIPGPAGLVQRAKLLKENVFILDPYGALMYSIHYKVLDVGSYGKDIIVGAAMILANVSVFTPKPSEHYLNITKRNVVEVFRKDTISLV